VFPTYRIARGAFDRWYIFHPSDSGLAWSGSRWEPTIDGIPTGGVQVCSFSTSEEALEYVEASPPEVAKSGSR